MAQFAHYYIKYKHDFAPYDWEKRQQHLGALFEKDESIEFSLGEGEERKVYKHQVYHLNCAPQIIVMRFANDIDIPVERDFQPAKAKDEPSEKPSNLTEKDGEKQPNLSVSDFPTMVTWNVYQAIKLNRKAKYSWLADNLGVSERTIQRTIDDLKKLRYIDPEHSKVKGEWQLLK